MKQFGEKSEPTEKRIVVISGGPGFGKSSLLNELAARGYHCGAEAAREIMHEQLQRGGDLLPYKKPKTFQSAVLERRIRFFESVEEGELAFSDRGIPDQLAFSYFRGFQPDDLLIEKVRQYRYLRFVFICPPWELIYVNDDIRKESFEEACRIHRFVCKVYVELGYRLHELPLAGIAERTDFLLTAVQNFEVRTKPGKGK